MDEALACHAGGRGLNLDKTKEDFFLFGKKFKYLLLSHWVSHHVTFFISLLLAHSY